MKYIFHHNDPDGYFSAALFMYKSHREQLKFIEMSHPEEPFCEDITKNDTVYIVDYNPGSIENLERLCNKAEQVIWIDHHVSSYNKFKDVKIKNLSYYYNENKCSSCEQVFNYFYLYSNPIYDDAGYLIKLISDFDSWKHNFPESINAFYGVLDIKDPYDAFECLTHDIDEILSKGKHIYNYILYNATKLKGFKGRVSRVDKEYTVLLKNTHLKGMSLFTKEEQETYDFCLVFNFKNNVKEVCGSVYSLKYDCSELLTYYNIGGGHKGAAGFTCLINTFNLLFIGD